MYYNRFEVAMGQGNHPMLPVVGGHVWFDKRGERTSAYKLSGPGRWPLVDKHGRDLRRSMWCWHGEEAQPSGGEGSAGFACGAAKECVPTLKITSHWRQSFNGCDDGGKEITAAVPDRKAGGKRERLALARGPVAWSIEEEEDEVGLRAGGRRWKPSAEVSQAEGVVSLRSELEEWPEDHMHGDKAQSTQKPTRQHGNDGRIGSAPKAARWTRSWAILVVWGGWELRWRP